MPAYHLTDREVLNEVEYALFEPADSGVTIASGLWTIAELVGYANDRQRRLLRETAAILKTGVVGAPTAVNRVALPADWILTRRVAFQSATGTIQELDGIDTVQADLGLEAWDRDRDIPAVYTEHTLPPSQLQLIPAPRDAGMLHLLYVGMEATLSNNGVFLSVPDEFACYVKWGMLADALRKAGPTQDLERAAYCEERFQEGIELGRFLMSHVVEGANA
jgi:hypothetical protein